MCAFLAKRFKWNPFEFLVQFFRQRLRRDKLGLNWVCFGILLALIGFELALIGFELALIGFVFLIDQVSILS
jgi:ABC-type polysaccharide/polyol phosphate export permease